MKPIHLFFIILFFGNIRFSYELSCKDERNRNVDWYILYKLPKISNEPKGSLLFSGKAYAYITTQQGSWKLSTQDIGSERSMLGKTWQELKKKEQSATYLFYNDDTPDLFNGSAVGHLKGILAFDHISGYWLSHSIPRFGSLRKFEFPDTATTNGQHAICVTFKTSDLDEIGKQLLYSHPNIYLSKLTNNVLTKLGEDSKSLFTAKPAFIRSAPFQRRKSLTSRGSQEFVSIVKDNQLPKDLFKDLIAPDLKTSLLVETWRRGIGTSLPPSCRTEFTVTDIVAINMTVEVRGRSKSIYFKSTEDHSKWAVSVDQRDSWVCMSDMNRMASQEKRGGGALCFKSNAVWREFRNIIAEIAQCPI